jgi:hypothetical protein
MNMEYQRDTTGDTIIPTWVTDTFSADLLRSIPKKVYGNIIDSGRDLTVPGKYGKLEWNFQEHAGTLIYTGDEGDFIQLYWEGHPDSGITNVSGTDERFHDIRTNLQFFVSVENVIYAEVRKMQEELGNFPVIKATGLRQGQVSGADGQEITFTSGEEFPEWTEEDKARLDEVLKRYYPES